MGTVGIRCQDMEDVYRTESFRCRVSGHPSVCIVITQYCPSPL
jgi:hypothetical protein